jgi:uncharacterized protein (DUF885 family)
LCYVRDVCKRVDPQLPQYFGLLPRCPYGVAPIPINEAPTASLAYYTAPSDQCKRAGYFYVNTYNLPTKPKFQLKAMALHETVPGHHLQLSFQNELTVPNFRKVLVNPTAYIEGWALYAETLGYDMGLYETPFERLGQLGTEMLRACRLVVDTGIHSLLWSRQEAIDYMAQRTPQSLVDIAAEVDRYTVLPGQALGYKIGQLKISEMKLKAQTILGANFDIRAFHDHILGRGALPLDILEIHFNIWLNDLLLQFSPPVSSNSTTTQ